MGIRYARKIGWCALRLIVVSLIVVRMTRLASIGIQGLMELLPRPFVDPQTILKLIYQRATVQ